MDHEVQQVARAAHMASGLRCVIRHPDRFHLRSNRQRALLEARQLAHNGLVASLQLSRIEASYLLLGYTVHLRRRNLFSKYHVRILLSAKCRAHHTQSPSAAESARKAERVEGEEAEGGNAGDARERCVMFEGL